MLISAQFARDMLLTFDNDALAVELALAKLQLWPITLLVNYITTIVGTSEYTLASNTVEVISVAFNGNSLPRTNEVMLDLRSPGWQLIANGPVKNYIYRNEIDPTTLRLFPPPNAIGTLSVLTGVVPETELAPWYELLVSLKAIQQLALSDVQRQRPKLAEFIKTVLSAFMNNLEV